MQFSHAGHYHCFVLRPRPIRWHNYTLLVTAPPEDYQTDSPEYDYGGDYDYDGDWEYDDWYYDGDYRDGYVDYSNSECKAEPDVSEGNKTDEMSAYPDMRRYNASEDTADETNSDGSGLFTVDTSTTDSDTNGDGGRSTTGDGDSTRVPRAPYFEDQASLRRWLGAPTGLSATIHCPVRGG